MGKLIPLLLILIGAGGGVGAGIALRPQPEPAEEAPAPVVEPDYVKLNNQFVVPVVEQGRVASLVIMSLSLATTGGSEPVFAREPRLRDAFLQVLFSHANTGGFRGSFTDADNLVVLRRSLLETAKKILPEVTDVLIVDIMRQDS